MELKDYEQPDDQFRYGVPSTVSDASLRLAQSRIEKAQPTTGEAWGMARDLESMKAASMNLAEEAAFNADPNYKLGEDDWDELTKDIPPEDYNIFSDARSSQHARWIRDQYLGEVDKTNKLASMGWEGVAMHFGAALFDEGNLALALMPELAGAGAAHKLSRLSRALRVGGLSAAENAAVEAYLQQGSQTRGTEDILYAGLAGFALGAPIGAISRGGQAFTAAEQEALAAAASKAAEDLDKQTIDQIVKDATPNARATEETETPLYSDEDYAHSRDMLSHHEDALKYVQRGLDDIDSVPEELRDIVKKYQDDPDSLAMEIEMHRQELDDIEKSFDDSAGAMRTDMDRVPGELRPDDTPTPEELNAPRTVFGNIRYDLVGRLMSSDNPLSRWAASRMAEDAVGHAGGRVQKTTASEHATRLQNVALTNVYRAAEPALKAWVKENNLPWHSVIRNRQEFYKLVARSIREGGVGDANVDKVAQTMSKEFNELRKAASKANVKGFRQIQENLNYLPRLHKKNVINEYNAKFGEGQMIKLVEDAIRRAQPDLEVAMLKRIAKGYWRKIYKLANDHQTEFAHPISRESSDFVKELLMEAGVEGDELEGMVESFMRTRPKEGRMAYAKHRTGMDESFVKKLKDPSGNMVEVRIDDLFEDDAERLFSQYARTVSGHIGMADKMGIKSKAEWETYKARINAEGHRRGLSQEQISKDIKKLDTLYKGITGSPLEADPSSTFARSTRMIRDMNFIRIMNQVGFAQLAEIGTMLGTAGIRATFRHVPELRRIYKLAEDGKLDDDLLRELEAVIPLGTDRLRNQVNTRYDEHGFESFGKLDAALQVGKRITGDISGMAPVNIALHRMASKAIAQRFMDTALGKGGFSAKRLASFGLSKEDFAKIRAQMKTHATREPSMFGEGRKIRKLNIEDWTDPEAKQLFIDAMYRAGRKVIQENDIGNTHEWMHGSLGKIFGQFRSFMLVAWSKQTLYNLHMRDLSAFSTFMLSMTFGGLAYMAQNYINSIGRDDQQKYLRERFSPTNLAAASFQRAGMASLFPAAIDTGLWMGGFDPAFAYGRSTGLATGIIQGNPTVDAVTKGFNLLGLAKNARGEYDLSQSEWRNMTSLLPFSNATGVRNVIQALGEDLPRNSEKSRQY